MAGSVTVTVRGVNADAAAIVQAVTAKDIVVYSGTDQPEGAVDAMQAVVSESLRAYVYAIEISNYSNIPPSVAVSLTDEASEAA